MKKIIYLLTILLLGSCGKEELFIEEVSQEKECRGINEIHCLGIYNVEILSNYDDFPKDLIIAEDGYSADLGTVLTFKGTDKPGWRFLGWRKIKDSYCAYTPLVESDTPNIAHVYMHKNYTGNCNIGPINVKIVAEFVKTLD